MSKFFSPGTRGFYSQDIHGENMPNDVVEIEDAEWRALLDAEAGGKILTCGPNGRPIVVEREGVTS